MKSDAPPGDATLAPSPIRTGARRAVDLERLELAVDEERRRSAELQARLELAERKLHGIEEISRSLASEHNLERILEAVMEQTTALLGAERATLYLLDETSERLWSKVAQGDEMRTIELDVGQGIAGWVAEHSRTVNVKDAYKDPRFDASFDRDTRYITRSILCQPLTDAQRRTIGVIQVLNKRDGYFTTDDEDLLAAIGAQAAITIQNSKLYLDVVGTNISLLETQLRLEERTAEVEFLFKVERAAATAQHQQLAHTGMLAQTLEEYPCEAVAVVLVDPVRDTLFVEVAAGPEAVRLTGRGAGAGEELAYEVLRSREPLVTSPEERPELFAELVAANAGWVIRNVACIPIEHQGEALGCLQFVNRTDDPIGFDPRDVELLLAVGRRMALSSVLARALEEEKKAERLAAIGQMLSGVVHDLKTPLTVINGYAELMARSDEVAGRQDYKGLIKNQIAQIKAMTEELLAFARGDSAVYGRRVQLGAFLDGVADLLRQDLEGTGVELDIDLGWDGPVWMDERKMARVIYNLARNAREALDGEPGHFRIAVERDDTRVRFRFEDDGPGIPEAIRGRLFESFATYGKRHGTGLGLALVRKIVEDHEGTVRVESAPGDGATFIVELPLERPAPPSEGS